MSVRYKVDFLLFLRESPLCIKPKELPPAEDWMGPPPDTARNANKNLLDRSKPYDSPLTDPSSRRLPLERHTSRNSASNPDEIVLGPPRTSFASAALRSNKAYDIEKGTKDADPRDRFSFRNRTTENDGDRFRDSRPANYRRRDTDQDNEGWSTVKPRKSFGHEGAERFAGRMGGGGDRLTSDRKPRERDDREGTPRRTFDGYTRDKEEDGETRPRNGLTRGKSDPWARNEPTTTNEGMTRREGIDRAKSWRDRDPELTDDKTGARGYGARWGRDRDPTRVERDPEWMDEPADEKSTRHTEEDFKKFMDSMKARQSANDEEKTVSVQTAEAAIEAQKPPVQSAPAIENGPDKFFLAFGPGTGLDATTPGEKETAPKSKATGKSSRFTSFFNTGSQEDSRVKTEPPTPLAGPNGSGSGHPHQPDEEKVAFQQLLLKLQKQHIQPTLPPVSSVYQESQMVQPAEAHSKIRAPPAEQFQQYNRERDGPPRPPQGVQEIMSPQPMVPHQSTAARQDQLLQELVGQRQNSAGAMRMDPSTNRNSNNTEFLMNLMRNQPEASRPDSNPLLRMPQPQKQAPMPQIHEREPEFPLNRGLPPQQRQMRQPSFIDEQYHHEPDQRPTPQQPTQILQRPHPPPGLDHGASNWIPGGPPPQGRPMMPPPGLVGGPGRNMPMANMFPPNFPPAGYPPPPEAMQGMPPRSMQPPPGIFASPPPGFFAQGMGGFQGPGVPVPEHFGPGLFEGRGMPPGAGGAPRGAFPRQ